MKIFTGNANPALAKEICEHLGVPLGTATVNRFPDGETFVQINENIRGCDVYVIQPTCAPANDRIMELLIMIDALRRASAARITAVIPFFGYARQDRKDKPRVPITAKLVANLLTAAGANRVLTVDLHAQRFRASSTSRSTTSTLRRSSTRTSRTSLGSRMPRSSRLT